MARIKVRARALDMLGRQQMASIPNALHELFKNAYDAYANNVRVDYFRRSKLLVLHDDGVGMTAEEFETRWLTLGTESKVKSVGLEPYKDPNQEQRPVLGEKGIGRLAIATIGPQVLIVTRAERDNGLDQLVVSFINWSIFEMPGVDLDQIEIPIQTLNSEEELDSDCIAQLVQSVAAGVEELGLAPAAEERIFAELDSYKEHSASLVDALNACRSSGKRGTSFVIHPVDDILEYDIDTRNENEELPASLLKMLRGFSNTMMSDAPPPMIAAFYDHRMDGTILDLIGTKEFFTPEEFLAADHHIEGEFDEYGQFMGQVSIYREGAKPYTVPWDGAKGRATRCGAFKIKFAYLMGLESESQLPKEQYQALSEKLNKYGGLYVYKDGVRVLPYGNSDYDFLNIERRRTKAAKDWFFSYRRLFGVVELSCVDNSALVEKAGREGFRENLAYRQFQGILENLFRQLALDWFRETTAIYGTFRERVNEFKVAAELMRKRKQKISEKRQDLLHRLNVFYEEIEADTPQLEVDSFRKDLDNKISRIAELTPEEAARELLRLESDMVESLRELRDRFRIAKPRGLSLRGGLRKDFERSLVITRDLESDLFAPLEVMIDEKVTSAINEMRALVSRRRRIQNSLERRSDQERKKAQSLAKETRTNTEDLQKEVYQRTKEGMSHVDVAFKDALMMLEREDLIDLDDRDLRDFQQSLEEKLGYTVEIEIDNLGRLRDQVQAVLESVKEGTPLNETAAILEERSEILEDQLENYTELAQLGSAIGIIQHEFDSTVVAIRNGIKKIGKWAGQEPDLESAYQTIRTSFEHLDTYLGMFTPLNRRLYRKAISITGKVVRKYIEQIFSERFKRHRIEIESTSRFEGHAVLGYPATFLPPVINVVDNALYWLSRNSAGAKLDYESRRVISFDADDKGFLIGNNGPGIEQRDADRIFDLSFTRKLRGRGMGLAVAKKALQDAGFDITLEQVGAKEYPVFRIWTVNPDDVE